jgi:hypothetical protein
MNEVPDGAPRQSGALERDRLRGLAVDHGHEVLRILGTGNVPEGQCRCCLLARWAAGHPSVPSTEYVDSSAEYVDDDVVVIGGPDVKGLVVLPRRHISSLEELPASDRASVLAALRRATRSVSGGSPGSAARIAVLPATLASDGHVCLHVRPSEAEGAGSSSPVV